MKTKIKFWQWPNVLAVDAGIIAIAWLWVFSEAQAGEPTASAYVVLALSVWLTYLADRLFDVSARMEEQLRSARHQFAKRHGRILWIAWGTLLLLNIIAATTGLEPSHLKKGFILLLFCLAYTGLNQLLSKRFFPKELLVALIFAGGTQVFLPDFTEWPSLTAFTLICLINCLIISWKEKTVDALLEVRSLTSILDHRWFYPLLAIAAILSFSSYYLLALLPTLAGLSYLQLRRKQHQEETFRVLCDASLLLGPTLYFFCSGVLVR